MYERFTDRSRKVFQLANQEAQLFNHHEIVPVHVLLGLLKESNGIGGSVLKMCGLELKTLREAVQKLLPPGSETITMGRLPQTELTKTLMQAAPREAEALDHNHIGTEHLLLACLHPEVGLTQLLTDLGATPDRVREEVNALLGPSKKEAEEITTSSQRQTHVWKVEVPVESPRCVDVLLARIHAAREVVVSLYDARGEGPESLWKVAAQFLTEQFQCAPDEEGEE